MTPLEYIRTRYGVPAYRGRRVAIRLARFTGPDVLGTITGANTSLVVKPDAGQGYAKRYRFYCHPQEVRYLGGERA